MKFHLTKIVLYINGIVTAFDLVIFSVKINPGLSLSNLFIGAVDKYRVRKKFPLPRTIWDGKVIKKLNT